jgi:ABC-2 type transport system permease protein
MNTEANATPESHSGPRGIAPAVMAATRPMYWAVRRELWEYRSIYLAPLAVAALFLFGFLVSLITLPHRLRALSLDPAKQLSTVQHPFIIATGLIMATAFIVGLFYCLDALHGERRDRSILFWKSLPVSDLTAVLAKASIPILILLLSFAITIVTHLIMLLLTSAVLAGSGVSVARLWTDVFQMSVLLFYHLLTVHALWYAPIYAWLLLVSAWARRVPFLWALLPPFAIGIVEKIAFNTSHFAAMVAYRFSGPQPFEITHSGMAMDPMATLAPVQFFSTPGLWTGLVAAAIFLAGAVRLRRYRGPI